MDHGTAAGRTILELRIHGVSNTPPADMLDLPPADVVQVDGDTLGSFWTPTDDALARDTARRPDDVHHVPPAVRREAYSWGAMARVAGVPLGAALGKVGHVATRVLWAATVPFGTTNAGYWARRVPTDPPTDAAAGEAAGEDRSVVPEPTAAAVRVFGLALTLLLTAATTTVAVSTLGTACMGLVRTVAAGEVVDVCARVPTALYGLARLEHGERVALLSLVPVLVVLALVAVARGSQVRFDDRISATRAGNGRGGTVGPLLYRAGFWARKAAGPTALAAHLGAAVALVGVLLVWTAGMSGGRTAVVVAGLVVVGAAAVVVSLRADDDGVGAEVPPWRSWSATAVAVAGVVVWAVAAAASARTPQPSSPPELVGIDVAPTLLGVLLLGVAASALVWRHRPPRWRGRGSAGWVVAWGAVPVGAVVCVALVAFDVVVGPATAWLVWGATALLVLPGVVAAVAKLRSSQPFEGWNGSGPGVFLLVSAATAAVYSSLVVLGVQWWLRGGQAQDLADPDAAAGLFVQVLERVPAVDTVQVPSAYTEFGVAAGVMLAVFLVQAVVVAFPALRGLFSARAPWIPVAPGTTGDRTGATAWAFRDVEHGERTVAGGRLGPEREPGARPAAGDVVPVAARRVQRARHVAALTHRAETAVGVMSVACFAALAAALPIAVPGDTVAGTATVPAWMLDLTVPVLGAIAVSLVASALTSSRDVLTRPWGTLWDLVSFLPRSAHPFGPASYAERAVPEVRARVDAWLHATDVPADDDGTYTTRAEAAAGRRVVLSAHSLGAVIAAAVVLIRAGNPVPAPPSVAADAAPCEGDPVASAPAPDGGRGHGEGKVGLLTYGIQLRPYFGRFFPELLGPDVLGVPACSGPGWRRDPWRRQVPGSDARAERDALRAARRLRSARRLPQGAVVLAVGRPDDPPMGRWSAWCALAQLRSDRRLRTREVAALAARRTAPAGTPDVTAARVPTGSAPAALSDGLLQPWDGPLPRSLAALLRVEGAARPAWVNLWRRTDCLGFPVEGYAPNGIDRGAEEVDRGAYLFEVAAHGGYPRTRAYREAFADVVDRLAPPPSPPSPPSAPSPAPGAAARVSIDLVADFPVLAEVVPWLPPYGLAR